MDVRIANLTTLAKTRRAEVERRKGERDSLLRRKAELEAQLSEARERTETIGQAAVLLREASDYARDRARQQVQDLTTSALQSVFGSDYRFVLEPGEAAGRPTITCQVVTPYGDGDLIQTEGTDSRGGGVVDIQAIALRWAMLELYRPQIDGPLLLDEPAKHVSEEYVPLAGQFLREACKRFGRQVIMVTHNPHLASLADKVYRMEIIDGASRVREEAA